jgi:hypothetical protein
MRVYSIISFNMEIFKMLDVTENGSLVDEAVYATAILSICVAVVREFLKGPQGGGTGTMLRGELRRQGSSLGNGLGL